MDYRRIYQVEKSIYTDGQNNVKSFCVFISLFWKRMINIWYYNRLFQSHPQLSKAVKSCAKLSKAVQSCPKLCKAVQSCPKQSKAVQSCAKVLSYRVGKSDLKMISSKGIFCTSKVIIKKLHNSHQFNNLCL